MTLLEQIEEIDYLLDLQVEYHKFGISLISDTEDKIIYVESVRNHYFYNLFSNVNKMITERFEKQFGGRVIVESKYDPIQDILETFDFIKNSLATQFNILPNINEGFWGDLWDKTKQVASSTWDKTKKVVGKAISNAADFIKRTGISVVFEKLRQALMSGVGSAIQIALSFTGIGSIAVDVAWAIMLNYDMFMWISGTPNWFNLIIDVLCLLTGGTLSKVLGKFVGKAVSSSSGALAKLFENSLVAKAIQKVLPAIEKGLSWISGKMSQVGEFMVGKMGLTWAKNAVSKCVTFVKQIVPSIRNYIKNVATKIGEKVVEKLGKSAIYNNLSKKSLLNFLEKGLDKRWVTKFAEGQINKQTIGRLQSYIKTKLKDYSEEEIIAAVKKYFGDPYDSLVKLYSQSVEVVKDVKSLQGKKGYKAVSKFKDVTTKYGKNLASNVQTPQPGQV